MKLIVDPSVVEMFSDLRIACVFASGVDNRGRSEPLVDAIRDASTSLADRMTRAELEAHPHIDAWRDAYRAFGINPKKKRPSAEAYLRRVLDRKQPGWISNVVGTYLLAEIQGFLPVGGYDLDAIEGDVRLRRSAGGEAFTAIGASEPEDTKAGEVVYADASRVLTRAWNYRDCDHAKIHQDTSRLALFVEAPTAAVGDAALDRMVETIGEGLERHCGASVLTRRLDVRESNELEFMKDH